MSKFDQCYLRWRGKVSGPFSWTEIERKLDSHEIGLLHDLQQNNQWTTLGEYLLSRGEPIRAANMTSPPPPLPGGLAINTEPNQKFVRIPNRWIFVALGVLFGFLGLHDFYAHHWIRGAFLLALAALLWLLDWGIVWPWLWALGEVLLTKVDGKGRRMPWKRTKND
jgi:TM2 domain-containing membrane protein YozV